MKGNMKQMMKQVQQMQSKMKEVQDGLGDKEVEASSGGDMVIVKVTGHQELKEITIHPEVVNPEDIEMLQDLVIAAVNEGLKKASEMASSEMSKVTGGLNLPPGMEGLM
ncbi:MAG: nucleoid-associated protein [bacterium]|nr:MAG: nucleoid-associated protein [bacterium]